MALYAILFHVSRHFVVNRLPLKYNNDNLNDVQKKITTRDKAKHTYILNNHNIEILYLWENDIYNNLDMCNLLLHEYIRSDGKLNNYHSFN